MRASRSSLFYTMPKKTTEKQNLVVAADTKPEDKPVVVVQADVSAQKRKAAALDAEIRWCLKVIQSHFSYNSNKSMKDLFLSMFPDSQIVQDYAMSKDKAAYWILYGIAPHFKADLMKLVEDSPFHSLLFDESLNKCIQQGQMDLQVEYQAVLTFLVRPPPGARTLKFDLVSLSVSLFWLIALFNQIWW